MGNRYVYTDADGEVVGCVDRCSVGESCSFPECRADKKHFMQYRTAPFGEFVLGLKGQKLPLYRLVEVRAGIKALEAVYLVEGEGKADRLAEALKDLGETGVPTTIAGGCNEKLTADHLNALDGVLMVFVITDSDAPGRTAAKERARVIADRYPQADVRVIDLYPDRTDGSDIGDFLDEGRTADEFFECVSAGVKIEAGSLMDEEIELLAEAYQERLRSMGTFKAAQVPRSNDEDDERRYCLGIDSIDRRMGPLFPGNVTAIGARQGEGKTTLLLHAALENAKKYETLFATLEMTREEIRDKALAHIMGQSLDEVERARARGFSTYSDAVKELARLKLYIWEPRSSVPLGAIDRSVKAIAEVAEAVKADIVFIDYTRMITGWRDGNPGGVCSDIIEELVEYAKYTRIHIFIASQLNRTAQNKRPSIEMLQDTGRIEQRAHKVLLLWQPFAEGPPTGLYRLCELILAKHRRGYPFRGHVGLIPHVGKFISLSLQEEQEAPCCAEKKNKSKEKFVSIHRESA